MVKMLRSLIKTLVERVFTSKSVAALKGCGGGWLGRWVLWVF